MDHVGMLSLEAFITEGNNPLCGNTIPEFAELQRDDNSTEKMIVHWTLQKLCK